MHCHVGVSRHLWMFSEAIWKAFFLHTCNIGTGSGWGGGPPRHYFAHKAGGRNVSGQFALKLHVFLAAVSAPELEAQFSSSPSFPKKGILFSWCFRGPSLPFHCCGVFFFSELHWRVRCVCHGTSPLCRWTTMASVRPPCKTCFSWMTRTMHCWLLAFMEMALSKRFCRQWCRPGSRWLGLLLASLPCTSVPKLVYL